METCYVVCLENNIDRPKFVFDRLNSNSASHSDRRLFLPLISPVVRGCLRACVRCVQFEFRIVLSLYPKSLNVGLSLRPHIVR